ncbi:hypothetical protein [Thalassotalea agarivorans]|uniref:TRAP transporter T-component n=1 Tax=Thalassotalea agarivorans TaxID=349064 RepID=A0A1H9ZKS6_THASX|nr:hypothetical protein [Thalassotalea agarivorans]SES82329.1 hypothetical protein SAMN05660429_00496 [Thalassotalea agarivorans]
MAQVIKTTLIILMTFVLLACGDKNTEKLDKQAIAKILQKFQKTYSTKGIEAAYSYISKQSKLHPREMAIKANKIGSQIRLYELDQKMGHFTDLEKKAVIEVKNDVNHAIFLYEKMEDSEQINYNGMPLLLAGVLEAIYQYEESIKIFEKYFDEEQHIQHPTLYVSGAQYANSLAFIGRKNEGDALYLSVYNANKKDEKIVMAYLRYQGIHHGYERMNSFYQEYVESYRLFAGLDFQVCYVSEFKLETQKAVSCYQDFSQKYTASWGNEDFINHADTYVQENS